MSKIDEKIIDFVPEILEKACAPIDPEEILFWAMSQFIRRFECLDASIYLLDKDRKNGYAIVSGRETKQRNIPFTVRVKPEIAGYLEQESTTVPASLANFEKGVFKFEEFVKILIPIDPNESCFICLELDKPSDPDIKNAVKVGRILTHILKPVIEKTEINKLLYGIPKGEIAGKAEDRNRTLAELAGSVAHLLNQPLTSLMGNVELLIRRGNFDKQGLTFLNKIYNEAERLADIIRKIESVNSYATEEYLGSTKILRLEDLTQADNLPKGAKTQVREKRVSKKLEVFLDLYKAISASRSRGEIIHHYAFAINRMFPNLKLLLLNYRADRDEFLLEYKEKGGYSRDFELSMEKIEFYKKILGGAALKIFRFDDNSPHIIAIPLVIDDERMGIAEYDFEKEEISIFDLILIESMTDELVLALRKLKLAEKNRYLKDYISNLVENTTSLIFVLDEQYAIRTCNPAFEETMGVPKSELNGKKLSAILAEASVTDEIDNAVTECFGGRVIKKLDMKLKGGKNEPIDTRFTLIPLPKVKNLRPEIGLIGQNITEVKQLENQIMQSEKLAYLGQMAACVAHELNNPLTSITVFTEYLIKSVQGEPSTAEKNQIYRDKLSRIFESANRIHSFTRNLTSFAQPSDNSSPEKINLNNIIKESILFSDYEIDKNTIKVDCRLEDDLPLIDGFKSQLHQVFINLITNAVHALGRRAGTIMVATEDFDDDFVKVEVRDDGQGMEEEVAVKIFEPFYSTRRGEGGTGLGLTIVKKIIGNHKGEITVKSEPGKGTVFSIMLPKQF